MNDNGNIRLLTPENDMRVRAFFSSLEDLSKRVEKICDSNKPSLDGERYYNDKELADYKQELVTNNLMPKEQAHETGSSKEAMEADAKAWAESLPNK